MASKIDWGGKRDNSFKHRFQPKIVSKRGGDGVGKKNHVKRDTFI